MKRGRPFRVERRRAGVSIGLGQLPRWSIPARALPLLHAFTVNFMVFVLFGQRQKESERTKREGGGSGRGFRQGFELLKFIGFALYGLTEKKKQ